MSKLFLAVGRVTSVSEKLIRGAEIQLWAWDCISVGAQTQTLCQDHGFSERQTWCSISNLISQECSVIPARIEVRKIRGNVMWACQQKPSSVASGGPYLALIMIIFDYHVPPSQIRPPRLNDSYFIPRVWNTGSRGRTLLTVVSQLIRKVCFWSMRWSYLPF